MSSCQYLRVPTKCLNVLVIMVIPEEVLPVQQISRNCPLKDYIGRFYSVCWGAWQIRPHNSDQISLDRVSKNRRHCPSLLYLSDQTIIQIPYYNSTNHTQEKYLCSLVLKLKKWDVLYFWVLTGTLQHGVLCTRVLFFARYGAMYQVLFSKHHIKWKQLQ